jgi:hypothetical protein
VWDGQCSIVDPENSARVDGKGASAVAYSGAFRGRLSFPDCLSSEGDYDQRMLKVTYMWRRPFPTRIAVDISRHLRIVDLGLASVE